jgi:hypothetical protein
MHRFDEIIVDLESVMSGLVCASSQKSPSSAPAGHLLPDGEGKKHPLSHRERVAEGRVRGQGRNLAPQQLPNRTLLTDITLLDRSIRTPIGGQSWKRHNCNKPLDIFW